MKDNQLYNFFNSIIDHKLEKEILQLILQGRKPNEIIEKLVKKTSTKDNECCEVEE